MMKLCLQKFFVKALTEKHNTEPLHADYKNKVIYSSIQILIWLSIFFVCILMINFLKNNI